jgi:DegV family protein with EDD domain
MIRIITDSTSDFTLEDIARLNIDMAHLGVNFSDASYIDKKTITSEEFYNKLKNSKELPTTTLVNPEQFVEIFNKYPNDEIIGIFISSTLSGTYQSAVIAKEIVNRDNIHLIDSKTVTLALALLVKEAVKMRDSGKNSSEIVEKITILTDKVMILAVIDTLKYLVKGGRLSAVSGTVGGVLGLKPIIGVQNGEIKSLGKERGNKKALETLVKIIKDDYNLDYEMPVVFGYSENKTDVEELYLQMEKVKETTTMVIGSVVGTHAGPGVIGLGFFSK